MLRNNRRMESHRSLHQLSDMCDNGDFVPKDLEDKAAKGDPEADADRVQRQRAEEIRNFAEIGVYTYGRLEDARRDERGIIIDTTWVDDLVKGKSRLCAREFAKEAREDLFATTPSLTASKWVVSEAASWEQGQPERRLMIMDVKCAFL